MVLMEIKLDYDLIFKATPWKHHDIQWTKVDFVTDRGGDAWGTMNLPGPGQVELPYMLEIYQMPTGGLPVSYNGADYVLDETADGGLSLTPLP